MALTFQQLILNLSKYWSDNGCVIQQPYDIEKGASTMNPATYYLRCKLPWRTFSASFEQSGQMSCGFQSNPSPTVTVLISLWASRDCLQNDAFGFHNIKTCLGNINRC